MLYGTNRPLIVERSVYVAGLPCEQFIVPLLKANIDSCLADIAKWRASGGKVLDVGCGGQPFRHQLEHMRFRYHSADANQNPQGTVEFVCTIDGQLPHELTSCGPFDFILCTEVLEHVADWDTAFVNFFQLLAPGGRMLLTIPHIYRLHEEPYDFWRPTPHAVAFFTEKVGLKVQYFRKAGSGWDILGTILGTVV